MIERENNVIKNELEQRVSDENIDVIVNYINSIFDDTPNSNIQLANMVKLSNYLNKNSFLDTSLLLLKAGDSSLSQLETTLVKYGKKVEKTSPLFSVYPLLVEKNIASINSLL